MSKRKHKKVSTFPGSAYGTFDYESRQYGNHADLGMKWIYAMLLVIVVVLQFGRNDNYKNNTMNCCCGCSFDAGMQCMGLRQNGQLIDNSILFIIVVFLLVFFGCCRCGSNDSVSERYGGYSRPVQ